MHCCYLKGFLIYQKRKHKLCFCLGTSALHGKGLKNINEDFFFLQAAWSLSRSLSILFLFYLIRRVRIFTHDRFINTAHATWISVHTVLSGVEEALMAVSVFYPLSIFIPIVMPVSRASVYFDGVLSSSC